MELALASLVGAGLTLVFEGFEESVPQGAVENGLRLVQFIAKHRPDVVVSLTEGVVKDIWKEWRQAKLPAEVAIAHVEALPAIMDRCRSSDGMMLGAVAAIQVARRIGSAARPVSHSARVATAIIGRALETGQLSSRGLNESIAFFFLDRLLARLMPDQQLFLDLRPLFLEYLDSGAWRTPLPATETPEAAPVVTEDCAHAEAAPPPADTPAETVAQADCEAAPLLDAGPHDHTLDGQIEGGVDGEALDEAGIETSPGDDHRHPEQTAAASTNAETAAETEDDTSIETSAETHDDDQPTAEAATEQPAPNLIDHSANHCAETTEISPDIARIAEMARAPASVLAHLAHLARSRLGSLNEATLEDLAVGLQDILARLSGPSDPDPIAADLKRQASAAVAACDLAGADRLLGQSEDIHLKAAPLDMSAAHAHLVEAASTRACRAQLEELAAEFRRAARHYAAAARCLGDSDRRTRRNLLMRQAGALVAQGEMAGDTAALAEAAQVYADAGRLLSEQDAPLDWAISHLELGRILMELGEREARPERYLAAALHFKPACDVFSRFKQADNWARAQLGIADALRAQGEVQGDVVTLSEASFAYRAALGIATRDRMPLEWGLATFRLSATLLRIDHETGELAHHEEAAMGLRAVLSTEAGISDVVRCSAQAKLAQALLALGRARGEIGLQDEALDVLRATRDAADRNLKGSVRAHHDDSVGSLLHEIGEARRNAALLSEASEMKLAALDHFEAHGPDEHVERIRGELSKMEQSVATFTRAAEETVAA